MSRLLRHPILERELVSFCRTKRWFVLRALLVGLLAGTCGIFLATADFMGADYDEMGIVLFAISAFGIVSYIFLVTPGLLADLIVSERRRETLEILLVTPLRPLSVVLGKFASRLLPLFAMIVATFPVVSLALLYGGVREDQVLGLALVSLGAVFFASAPALLITAYARRLGTAAVLSYVIPVFLGIAVPWIVIAGVADHGDSFEGATWLLCAVHPFFAAASVAIDDLGRHVFSSALTPGLLSALTGAVTCLASALLAARRLRHEGGRPEPPDVATAPATANRPLLLDPALSAEQRCGLLEEEAARLDGIASSALAPGLPLAERLARLRERLFRVRAGSVDPRDGQRAAYLEALAERLAAPAVARPAAAPTASGPAAPPDAAPSPRRRRVRLLRRIRNPMMWKELNLINASHSRLLSRIVLAMLLLSVIGWLGADDGDAAMPIVAVQTLLLLIVVAVNAASAIVSERETGTLDLLRITPITPAQIVRAKLAGVLRSVALLTLVPATGVVVLVLNTDTRPLALYSVAVALPLVMIYFAAFGLGSSARQPRAGRAVRFTMLHLGILLVGVPFALGLLATATRGEPDRLLEFALFGNPVVLVAYPILHAQEHSISPSEGLLFVFVLVWSGAYAIAASVRLVTLPATLARALRREAP